MGLFFADKDATGRLYKKPEATLKLGRWAVDGFAFTLPVWITLRPRLQIIVTAVEGLKDTVKEIMDMQGFDITIESETGNWEVRTIFRASPFMLIHGPIKTINDIRDVLAMCRDQKKPLKAVDSEGILAAAGIQYVVIHDVHLEPIKEKSHAYRLSLGCYSELEPDTTITDLMPEQGLF